MIQVSITKKLHGARGEMDLNVDIAIKKNAFVALAGESGSGKTTFLRILSGLEEATGSIVVEGESWLDHKKSLPPQKRGIGFVFQDYALFENMSVEENLLYVNKDKPLANELLEITELSELKKRLPHTLSGGQKQRVNLCRALMKRPKLLLMDEPLSALDPAMRLKLQREITLLHKKFGTTTLMVSHDPSEIYKLCDHVIELHLGKIIKQGTPKEVLLHTNGSQKFSFEGELLDIIHVDVIHIAVVAIGQQITEVVISTQEAKTLKIGDRVTVSNKAFSPLIS